VLAVQLLFTQLLALAVEILQPKEMVARVLVVLVLTHLARLNSNLAVLALLRKVLGVATVLEKTMLVAVAVLALLAVMVIILVVLD
jgi:hypothetical protein